MKRILTTITLTIVLTLATLAQTGGIQTGGTQTGGTQRRTSFRGTFPGQGAGNVDFFWTSNDRIRLDNGHASRAERLSGNSTSATFVFDDADGLEAQSYVVYYPDKQVTIPTVQTQTGANNTDHVGSSGDCGVATAVRNDADGTYSFTLQHKSAYLCFLPHLDYMPSVRLTKIVLTADGDIAGSFQLSNAGLHSGTATSATITLNLQPRRDHDFFIGHSYATEQDSCAAYMVIAPQDASRTFTATYYMTDTLSRVSQRFTQTFAMKPEANTVYPITCHIPESLFREVDLGFDHLWSSVNTGGNLPNEAGSYLTRDAARQALTGTWQLPDGDDIAELTDRCTWQWGMFNGTEGWLVSGTNNGNDDIGLPRIFLPLSGYKANGTAQQTATGYYWQAPADTDPEGQAQVLAIGRDERRSLLMSTALAMNTRPVKDISRELRIPYSGTQTADLRTHGPGYSIKVYDHAGPDANYGNGASGYLRIVCAEGYKLNIVGRAVTESVSYDWLDVYEVVDGVNRHLGRYGGNVSYNLTTAANEVLLYFRSDGGTVNTGLDMTVTIQRMLTEYAVTVADAEGGTLTASTRTANPEDTIRLTATPAPGYVLDHIRVETEGTVLTVYDDDPRAFSTAAQATRHYLLNDTVRVRDGNWYHDESFFLMPYSNVTVTPVFVNTDATLFVNMAGNGSLTVERKYIQRLIDCGMTQFALYDHGGKNGNYGDNANGSTLIDAPVGWRLNVAGSTNLESGCDVLGIYDGFNTSAHQLGTPNGSFNYTTYNNALFFKFTSDGSRVYSGCDAKVTLIEDVFTTQYNIPAWGMIDLTEERMQPILDQGVTAMTVYTSTGMAAYTHGQDGKLRFTLPEGYTLRVTGSVGTESCCDYLKVYDDGVEKKNYAGEGHTVDYTTESRTLTLYFHSDGSVLGSGVSLQVEFIAPRQ